MKKRILAKPFRTAFLALAAAVAAQIVQGDPFPEVSGVSLTQPGGAKDVIITYTLANGPAIVTIDITTNNVSIGAGHCRTLSGAVGKVVENGAHTVKWNAAADWPGNTNDQVRAVVTAWSTNCPPDYMVVNLTANKDVRWYTCEDALPGGVTNMAYRQSLLVLRKIRAAGIPWTMGISMENGRYGEASGLTRPEVAHPVTLDHDYYMGIFEFTQGQWATLVADSRPAFFKNNNHWIRRPIENISYIHLMESRSNAANANYTYPAKSLVPAPYSYLELFRYKTGVAFMLPSEAEWEYAARAANPEGTWGDGSLIGSNNNTDGNLDNLARYARHDGKVPPDWADPTTTDAPDNGGTGYVGSYKANDWGLYDMHGNVWEMCLDWRIDDLTPNTTGDAAYVTTGTERVFRGGSWGNYARDCRASVRRSAVPSDRGWQKGFRVVVPTSLWRPNDEAYTP